MGGWTGRAGIDPLSSASLRGEEGSTGDEGADTENERGFVLTGWSGSDFDFLVLVVAIDVLGFVFFFVFFFDDGSERAVFAAACVAGLEVWLSKLTDASFIVDVVPAV